MRLELTGVHERAYHQECECICLQYIDHVCLTTGIEMQILYFKPTLSFKNLAASSVSLRRTWAEISSAAKSLPAFELAILTLPVESSLTCSNVKASASYNHRPIRTMKLDIKEASQRHNKSLFHHT